MRALYSRETTFLILIWNLFLAYIPFFISSLIKIRTGSQKSGSPTFVAVVVWFIFFPNAPYILTDFFHLYQREGIPLWFDLVILALFAWNGMIIGFLSLKDMQQMVELKYSRKFGWLFVLVVLIAGSFGVYMGRFLRYNSWDVVVIPTCLARDMTGIVLSPVQHKNAFGMTAGMALFLITSYYTFYRLSDN